MSYLLKILNHNRQGTDYACNTTLCVLMHNQCKKNYRSLNDVFMTNLDQSIFTKS